MTEPWFRMHANVGKRKVTARLMEHAGIDQAKAVGYLAMFWGALSQHCPGGIITDVPDSLLEEWAEWKGKRGVFAAFVRDRHATDGKVNDYDEYSGRLEERKARDRERKAANHAARNSSGIPAESTRKSQGTRAERRRNSAATIRNDTKRDKLHTTLAPDGADGTERTAPPAPPDQPADGDDPIPTTNTSWVAEFGDVYKAVHGGLPNYGKLGKHLKPAVDAFGRERALAAWRRFCASADVRFGPAHFVEHFGAYESQLIGAGGDEAAILAWMAEDRT